MHHGLETITIREVALTYPNHLPERLQKASGQDAAASVVREIVRGRPQEHFVVLHLDAQNQIVSYSIAGIGTVDTCLVHPREVFGPALKANASNIILAHNHPSGDTTPSPQDRDVTRRLKEVGELLGCQVLDSLIVTLDSYQSLMHWNR
jgi:DNA repair protein RadC